MRLGLALAFASLFCLSAFAQEPTIEYGKPEELKALKRVYVDTGIDLPNRARIHKEIEKANVGLTLLDDIQDADILLSFKVEKGGRYNTLNVATGAVYVIAPKGLRVVMSYEGAEKYFQDKPANAFAKRFLKVFRKANGK